MSSGRLKLSRLSQLDDDRVREALVSMKGIGHWTADIYLMMALRRPDIWPIADLALASAVKEVKRLRKPLDAKRMERVARPWSPWRSVAARVCWHHYLSVRGISA